MPTLDLPSPFALPLFGCEYEPVTRPASAPATIEGFYPYGVLSDYNPGGFGHQHERTVFMPGAFSDYLRLVAGNPRLSVCLLVGHDYGRQLATTADGTLRVWEDAAGLHWRARARSPAQVRYCSLGCGNTTSRLHTFKSGETVRVIERAHLLEVSLVEKPATPKARAWAV